MVQFYLCYCANRGAVTETFPDDITALARYEVLRQAGHREFMLFHVDNGENPACEDGEYTDPDEARCYILVQPDKAGGYTWSALTAAGANKIMRQNEGRGLLAFHRNTSDL